MPYGKPYGSIQTVTAVTSYAGETPQIPVPATTTAPVSAGQSSLNKNLLTGHYGGYTISNGDVLIVNEEINVGDLIVEKDAAVNVTPSGSLLVWGTLYLHGKLYNNGIVRT
jgi:hypothetical protein